MFLRGTTTLMSPLVIVWCSFGQLGGPRGGLRKFSCRVVGDDCMLTNEIVDCLTKLPRTGLPASPHLLSRVP